ncbi:hypothetical protein PI125_g22577 [Phytophthora idaei]|nr:hypothetical protein PI125_g22577 [Phytophthora idaei]
MARRQGSRDREVEAVVGIMSKRAWAGRVDSKPSAALKRLMSRAHIDHCAWADVRIQHQQRSAGSGADFSLKSGTRTTQELT